MFPNTIENFNVLTSVHLYMSLIDTQKGFLWNFQSLWTVWLDSVNGCSSYRALSQEVRFLKNFSGP